MSWFGKMLDRGGKTAPTSNPSETELPLPMDTPPDNNVEQVGETSSHVVSEVTPMGSLLSLEEKDRPVILCDVGNTLAAIQSGELSAHWINHELIAELNKANAAGFRVQLITGSIDVGNWHYDSALLKEKTTLDTAMIDAAKGKYAISCDNSEERDVYKNVVAVIDDNPEDYIDVVKQDNPKAKVLLPDDLNILKQHLSSIQSAQRDVNLPG